MERGCINGEDPDAPYPVPRFSADFKAAPDLERIANELISACGEFEDIAWAIEEEALVITYVWKKKGAKTDGMIRTGALAKTGGMVKHFAGANYVIGLSADACFGRTRFQIEAEIWHQLRHINIQRKTTGKGDDKVTVPVLKKRAHDLEMFFGEVDRYGLWRTPLKQGQRTFAQAPLFDGAGAAVSAGKSIDEQLDDLHELGATISHDGRSLQSAGELSAAVADVMEGAVKRKRANSSPSNTTPDQADALHLAGATAI